MTGKGQGSNINDKNQP